MLPGVVAVQRPPAAERRRAIVQVAYRLIAERGLEGLRFSDVARAAGINNGTLLYYFASKDELVHGVVGHLIEEFSDIHAPTTPGDTQDPLVQLRREFEDVRYRLRERPEVSIVYAELAVRASRDPAVADLLRQLDDGWRGWLAQIVSRGQERGTFRADLDVDLATNAIMALAKGLGLHAVTGPGRAVLLETVTAELARLIEIWLVG